MLLYFAIYGTFKDLKEIKAKFNLHHFRKLVGCLCDSNFITFRAAYR